MTLIDSPSLSFVAGLLARVTIVLALTWLGARVASRRSASMRHALWVAAFLGVLALPVAARLLPAWRMPVLPAVAAAEVPVASSAAPVHRPGGPAPAARTSVSVNLAPPAIPAQHDASASTPWLSSFSRVGPLTWALVAWVIVGGGLLARYALGLAAVSRMIRRARPVGDRRWMDALDVAAAMLTISRTPRLLVSTDVTMPFTCGFFTPTLVVPASASGWTDERIDVVMRHELAHVARRDCLVQAVTQAALALYWFHPLAWIGAKHLRAERERACDDLVLASGTRGTIYAEHLLDIARSAASQRSPMAAAALAMARPSELEGRLLAILDPRRERRRTDRRRVLQVALASVAVVVPLASVTLVARSAAQAAATQSTDGAAIARQSVEATVKSTTTATRVATSTAATVSPTAITRSVTKAVDPQQLAKHLTVVLGPDLGEAVAQSVVEGVSGGVRGGVRGGIPGGIGRGDSDNDREEQPKPVSPAVVQALTEALKDSDADVRKSAMQALARFRAPAAYDAFVAGLKDPDAEVRQQAAFALSQLRDPRSTEPLIGALKDQNDEVREQALFALSQIRDPGSVPALISALSDSKANVRRQAAFALSQIGDEHAVPALVAALKDSDAEVREQAAFALSQIGDETAIEPLTALLKDPAPEVRQQAIFALSQLAGGEPRHGDHRPKAAQSAPVPAAPAAASPAPMAKPTPQPAPRPR